MKNKIRIGVGETILIILGVCQLFIMILPWLGVVPPERSSNLFIKIWALLWLEIPLIWFIFIYTLTLTYIVKKKKGGKNSNSIKSSGDKTAIIQPKIELNNRHYFILLNLLDSPNRSLQRYELQGLYEKKFNALTADFNILRQELLDEKLIDERSGGAGCFWKLTSDGLRVATEKYKLITKENIK